MTIEHKFSASGLFPAEQEWGHIFGSIDEAVLDQAVRNFPRLLDRCRAVSPIVGVDIGETTLAQIRAKYHAILAERRAA